MGGPSVSVRVAWPFWRILPELEPELAVLRQAGIESQQLGDPDLRLSYGVTARLLETSLVRGVPPSFGLEAGLSLESLDIGPLDFAARYSATVRQAFNLLARYLKLLDDGVVGYVQQRDDRFVWRLDYPSSPQHPAAVDFAVAASLKTIRYYCGQPRLPLSVAIGHAGLAPPSTYERLLDGPVELNATFTGFVTDAQVLDRPMARPNAVLQSAFIAELDRLVERMPTTQSCSQQVRQHLLYRLTSGDCNAGEVARSLSLSQATLRRRLAREGTSYSKILDEARKEIALRQIRRVDRSVGEIAHILGFNTTQGFCKAFKRWTETTPMDYRSQVVAEERYDSAASR